MKKLIHLTALLICFVPLTHTFAQPENTERMLMIKTFFANQEINSLAEAFVGLSTDSGIESGLFPIRSTGISNEPIVDAANLFLDSLSPLQKIKSQFSVNDPEWRRWSNVDNGIYTRQGISFEEMNQAQKNAAWNLLQTSLSAKGIELSRNIMKTDQTLREINQDEISFGEEKYFITIMGSPSEFEPWGWQLDGHHLAINYFVLGDQIVATPMFLGGEPIITETGIYAGNELLQEEQDTGLRFIQSLDEAQREIAIVEAVKDNNDIQAQAWQDNLVMNYTGIKATDFNYEQSLALIDLIALFINNIKEDHAQVRMDEIIEHLDETYFAWIGSTEEDAVFYYRIHSPVVLIEFDHQAPVGNNALPRGIPTRQHIHTVIRTPNGNDYGKDLLRQHLLAHPH